MKRLTTILTILLLLPGCSTGLSQTGLSVSATSTTAAVIGTAVGGPAVGFAAGAISGIATDVVVDERPTDEEIVVTQLDALPVEERAEALKAHYFWATIERLGLWAIAAVFGFFLIPLMIGYFIPTRRQRKLERMAFDHPDIKHRDI